MIATSTGSQAAPSSLANTASDDAVLDALGRLRSCLDQIDALVGKRTRIAEEDATESSWRALYQEADAIIDELASLDPPKTLGAIVAMSVTALRMHGNLVDADGEMLYGDDSSWLMASAVEAIATLKV